MVKIGVQRSRHSVVRRGHGLVQTVAGAGSVVLMTTVLIAALNEDLGQARNRLCASRMAQMTRAMLLYADDYDGTPPFIGRGWEDCDTGNDQEWPTGSGITVGKWKRCENWLLGPNMPDCWTLPQAKWPQDAAARSGSLYPYTRFEALYLCPEFEKGIAEKKSQNAFNYTRTFLGRKWFASEDPELKPGSPFHCKAPLGGPGPIMKVSSVFSPKDLHMMIDESWRCHVAAPVDEFNPPLGKLTGGGWMAADPMFYPLGSEIGQYHGRGAATRPAGSDPGVGPVGRGNISFYDGHVVLGVEPLPGKAEIPLTSPAGKVLMKAMSDQLYAQRGVVKELLK